MSSSIDKTAVAIQVAMAVAAVFDHDFGGHAQSFVYLMQAREDGSKIRLRSRSVETVANPHFLDNGHEGDSPVTQSYLNNRRWKKVASSGNSIIGNLTSALSAGHNIPGIAAHGQATGLTLVHMVGIERIARNYRQSKTIADWCLFIQRMKALKAATRGSQLAGSIVPAASMPTTIAAAVVKAGVKLTVTGACLAAAAEIHWRAFQEQAIGGGGQKIGPASRIMTEIFAKRGGTRLFGNYDVPALIREPAGWQALGDKLSLI